MEFHQPIPQGVFGAERGQFRADLRVPSEDDVRGQGPLDAVEPVLRQPGRRRLEDPPAQPAERHRPPPQLQRPAQQQSGAGRFAGGVRRRAQPRELPYVQHRPARIEQEPGIRADHRGPRVREAPAQQTGGVLQLLPRRGRRVVPHRLRQSGGRHHPPRLQRERRQHPAAARPADLQHAPVQGDVHRTQQGEDQGHGGLRSTPWRTGGRRMGRRWAPIVASAHLAGAGVEPLPLRPRPLREDNPHAQQMYPPHAHRLPGAALLTVVLLSLAGLTAPEASAAPSGPTVAVAMGDSFISGEGARWLGNTDRHQGSRNGSDRAWTGGSTYDPSKVYGATGAVGGCHRSGGPSQR
ncbi:hypothetical protein WKI68_15070 [Streptomyces sp. MS1.HAVA.3]|uniref:Uncharacterized protein n=1 Tax=Streptomyces caledonius TaxID=3134107 RepID=A0ABU8U4Z4_9ACTN